MYPVCYKLKSSSRLYELILRTTAGWRKLDLRDAGMILPLNTHSFFGRKRLFNFDYDGSEFKCSSNHDAFVYEFMANSKKLKNKINPVFDNPKNIYMYSEFNPLNETFSYTLWLPSCVYLNEKKNEKK